MLLRMHNFENTYDVRLLVLVSCSHDEMQIRHKIDYLSL